ncbi:hypothetical protein EDC94DRAFT_588206 [Helicostylum pulchrum]|nr:hypothetical protein EDC94DRAFT_588206 [Helicostylum pulchrum]
MTANYWKNYVKQVVGVKLNDRTPFVEHVVPLYCCSSTSAPYIKYSGLSMINQEEEYFLNGVGYSVEASDEILLVESSVDDGEYHSKENTMKLLECSIRSFISKAAKMKFSSIETFKKRSSFTCLYCKDKLTMVSTFLADKERWGFVFVREANTPRSRESRYDWLQVFELVYCLKERKFLFFLYNSSMINSSIFFLHFVL